MSTELSGRAASAWITCSLTYPAPVMEELRASRPGLDTPIRQASAGADRRSSRDGHVVTHRHRRGVPADEGGRPAGRRGDAPEPLDPRRATQAKRPPAPAPPMRTARSRLVRTTLHRPARRPADRPTTKTGRAHV